MEQEVEKGRNLEDTLSNISHSTMNARVGRVSPLSSEKLLAPTGSMSRARRLNLYLTK